MTALRPYDGNYGDGMLDVMLVVMLFVLIAAVDSSREKQVQVKVNFECNDLAV